MRAEETKIAEVEFHYLCYFFVGLWALAGTVVTVVSLHRMIWGLPGSAAGIAYALIFLLFFGPLGFKLLKNRSKSYILTSRRLYVEDGILAKTKRDIPVHKINDVQVHQGLLQRLLGAGDIYVLTGNDSVTVLKNVVDPDGFKNQIFDLMDPSNQNSSVVDSK